MNQLVVFAECLACGIINGFLFDVLHIPVIFLKKMKFLSDILCFFVLFALYLLFSIRFHFPDFRLYMFAGILIGWWIYIKSFHRTLDFLCKSVYNRINNYIHRKHKKHDR